MEWLETTARTVEEAKEALLDRLGVDEQETEFEVLEEPRPGLFGRTKGQARVRARVRPKSAPSRDDRRRRPKSKGEGRSSGAKDAPAKDVAPTADGAPSTRGGRAAQKPAKQDPAPDAAAPAAASGERAERGDRGDRGARAPDGPRLDSEVASREAREFLAELIDRFGVQADVTIEIDDDGDLDARVEGSGLGRLIGPRGGVISAIEELTRTRLQHVASGGSTPRFKLDIGGARASRRANLELLVDDVVARVRETGTPHVLDVVLAGERKLVHDRVAETAPDVATHSEGEDPVRRVVLSPA